MQRERDYKAEIKRLEVIMAKESTDGVASVHLARHDSLVNRSDSKRFEARLKRMSNSVDGTEPAPEDATGSLDKSVHLAKVAGCYQTIGTSCTRFLATTAPFPDASCRRHSALHRLQPRQVDKSFCRQA